MQWTPGGPSDDIEDRREESGGGGGGGGFGGMHLGIGGVIVVGLLSLIFRQNFFALLSEKQELKTRDGKPYTAFRGIPIRICDQLLNTEARVV